MIGRIEFAGAARGGPTSRIEITGVFGAEPGRDPAAARAPTSSSVKFARLASALATSQPASRTARERQSESNAGAPPTTIADPSARYQAAAATHYQLPRAG
jgi:hypothetical protein